MPAASSACRQLVQLAELELLEDLGGAKDAGVDDAGDSECSTDDGADGCEEVVERRSLLVVPNSYRVQVVPATTNRG